MKPVDFHNDVLPLKDKLFRVALRITLDRTEAEDITQETLVRVWERRNEWSQIENLEAWCLTIARRLALDHVQHSKMQMEKEADIADYQLSVTDVPVLPDEALDRQQRVEAVLRLIDQLPEVQRTIIQLRDIEGLRYEEIARITELSETQVKVYLHRARKKIRDFL
ncbi:MAG: RNA polymerase sigma factor [Bacteroidaceae bacterium]|nr:RNA polymerase sigma factor [Bacteroidaceae bacterium]